MNALFCGSFYSPFPLFRTQLKSLEALSAAVSSSMETAKSALISVDSIVSKNSKNWIDNPVEQIVLPQVRIENLKGLVEW